MRRFDLVLLAAILLSVVGCSSGLMLEYLPGAAPLTPVRCLCPDLRKMAEQYVTERYPAVRIIPGATSLLARAGDERWLYARVHVAGTDEPIRVLFDCSGAGCAAMESY
jgi:hypothetical protein